MLNKDYPRTCVWEVTMGCNMRCGHCGSSCKTALPGELTTQEAFNFIDMCDDAGLEWINLSGGEPFTRNRRWHMQRRSKSLQDVLLHLCLQIQGLKPRFSSR